MEPIRNSTFSGTLRAVRAARESNGHEKRSIASIYVPRARFGCALP